ncbi:hypothetical protein B0H11DRAFT_2268990 [Mycena galericulata]|nr:hypothetical protein B0H11DRAFT_2268990 [Mycena galericulata]
MKPIAVVPTDIASICYISVPPLAHIYEVCSAALLPAPRRIYQYAMAADVSGMKGELFRCTMRAKLEKLRATEDNRHFLGERVALERIENTYTTCPVVPQIYVHGDSLHSFLVRFLVTDLMQLAHRGRAEREGGGGDRRVGARGGVPRPARGLSKSRARDNLIALTTKIRDDSETLPSSDYLQFITGTRAEWVPHLLEHHFVHPYCVLHAAIRLAYSARIPVRLCRHPRRHPADRGLGTRGATRFLSRASFPGLYLLRLLRLRPTLSDRDDVSRDCQMPLVAASITAGHATSSSLLATWTCANTSTPPPSQWCRDRRSRGVSREFALPLLHRVAFSGPGNRVWNAHSTFSPVSLQPLFSWQILYEVVRLSFDITCGVVVDPQIAHVRAEFYCEGDVEFVNIGTISAGIPMRGARGGCVAGNTVMIVLAGCANEGSSGSVRDDAVVGL